MASTIRWDVRKWDGHLHRTVDATVLGRDSAGIWLFVPRCTRVKRPCGDDFDHPCDATVLLPYDSMWHATWLTDWDPPLYVDIARSFEQRHDSLTTVDLDLDLVRHPDRTIELLDEDEFERNQSRYAYPSGLIAQIHATVANLRPLVLAAEPPFTALPMWPGQRE